MDTNITRALGGQLDALKETLKAIKTGTFSADQKQTVKQVVRNDADNLYAQGLYARYLMHAQSYKKAIPLLKRVASQNCDSNQKKALRFIKGAALCSLGYCHQNGHELEQSYEEAVRYYLLAENEGHALAQHNLGVMYYSGQHVEQNFQKAFEYFSLAAKQECSYSQYNLGLMYAKGVYVEQDLKKAFEWYSLAAKQEYPYSQYNLGVMYTKGIYVKQDLEKAFEWYSLAAKQGDAKAQYNLGNMYYHGRHVQKNYEKAFEFYSSAAEQGLASAQCNLGGLYYRGEYVGENDQKAFEWYSLAAEQGHAKAQSKLASMYYLGFHITQNFQKVFELYSLAAAQGNATSLYNLGGMYKNGYHVTKDLRKAFEYYTQALVRAPQLTTLFSKTFSKDIDSLPTLKALEILQYMTLVLREHARTKTLSEENSRTITELLSTAREKASAISENVEEKDKEYKDYLMAVIEHGLDFLKYYKGPISYIISDPIWETLHTILDSTQNDKVNHFYFDLGLKILGSSLEEVQSKQDSDVSEETLGEKAIELLNKAFEWYSLAISC